MQETKILSLEDYRTGETALSEYRDLLNIDDLSKIFQVHKNTIYKHIKNGDFGKPIQIGRAYKIPKNFIIKKIFCSPA
ncbi:MAG: helix-turn-helix domain-containing protein [Oscillospiraceae bacterium]|nr:helix-turn-helix domain-containing protein [Oscillospiraceae bacterium]